MKKNKPLDKILTNLFKLKVWFNLVRLSLLNILIKDYTKKSLSKRKGSCQSQICKAVCCQPCKYIDKNYKCKIYNNRKIQKGCRPEIPVDEFELKFFKLDKNKCGYYWKK